MKNAVNEKINVFLGNNFEIFTIQVTFRNHVGNVMEMILNPTSENNSEKVNKWIHFFLENNGDGVLLHVDFKVQPILPITGTFDHNLTH